MTDRRRARRTRPVLMLALLAAAAGLAGAAVPPAQPADAETIAIVNAAVIDGTGAPVAPDQTLLIRNGRIAAMGPAAEVEVPAGARRIDGRGRTVIPGLIGMHDHTHVPGNTFTGDLAARLWLASGVTTVMTAGSAEPDAELALARRIAAGAQPGPEIVASAPYVTGPGGNGPMTKPADESEARRFVAEWTDRGVRWFKLYRHTEAPIARALIDEAHRRGAKVTGHLCSLSLVEAAALGIDGVEHGLTAATDFVPGRDPGECRNDVAALGRLDIEDEAVQSVIAALVRENVTVTSTLAILESRFAHRPQAEARSLVLMTPRLRQETQARGRALAEAPASATWTPGLWARILAFERAFVRAGGRLLMGPDPGRHVLPGHGNQRGFELLVEAGFPVAEAIQIATFNGAAALGVDHRTGRLAPGLEADLVMLRGDLAADPSVIRAIDQVFSDGESYLPEPLLEPVVGRFGPE